MFSNIKSPTSVIIVIITCYTGIRGDSIVREEEDGKRRPGRGEGRGENLRQDLKGFGKSWRGAERVRHAGQHRIRVHCGGHTAGARQGQAAAESAQIGRASCRERV